MCADRQIRYVGEDAAEARRYVKWRHEEGTRWPTNTAQPTGTQPRGFGDYL